jgi:hypothetical protein
VIFEKQDFICLAKKKTMTDKKSTPFDKKVQVSAKKNG